jgi:hypothetical protein
MGSISMKMVRGKILASSGRMRGFPAFLDTSEPPRYLHAAILQRPVDRPGALN